MGLKYTDTGVVLTNQANGTVVDSTGIVSTTQFAQAGSTNSADNQAIVGTAVQPLSNGTLNVVLDRSALVWYGFTADAYMSNTDNGYIFPTVGGTIPLGGNGKYFAVVSTQTISSFSSYHIETLPAGTTAIVLNASEVNGPGTCTLVRHKSNYLVLGK